MLLDGESDEEKMRIHSMFIEENRIKSFKDWVFDSCECTPKKLAAAGFFHCPTDQEPDAVRCFVCHKELDGWEPTDIPLQEHKKHSPNCPFLSIQNPSRMTVEETMRLLRDRYKLLIEKLLVTKRDELQDYAKQAVKQMEKLA